MKKAMAVIVVILVTLCWGISPAALGFKQALAVEYSVDNTADQALLNLVDDEYIRKAVAQIMDFDAPIPVEMCKNIFEAWKIKTFESYKEELEELGVTDEYWLRLGEKGLHAYDNKDGMVLGMGNFTNYVSRDKFIDIIVSGDTESVICDNDGKPVLLLINFTEKMNECFRAAIKKLEKSGAKNIYSSWRDSGACIFYADELQPGGGSARGLLNKWGIVNFNMCEDNTKNVATKGLANQFAKVSFVEPIGVSYLQRIQALGMNYLDGINGPSLAGYCEIIKDWSTYKLMSGLKGELKNYTEEMLAQAEYYAGVYSLSIDSDLSKRQIQLIFETTELPAEDLLKTAS